MDTFQLKNIEGPSTPSAPNKIQSGWWFKVLRGHTGYCPLHTDRKKSQSRGHISDARAQACRPEHPEAPGRAVTPDRWRQRRRTRRASAALAAFSYPGADGRG